MTCITIYRCDWCNKECGRPLRASVFPVGLGTSLDHTQGRDFCNAACLSEWATTREAEKWMIKP